MPTVISPETANVAEKCVQQIQALERELHNAMDSVARNALADLESSLWRQEMLSAGAKRLLSTLSVLPFDEASRVQILAAVVALRRVNRTYEGVVQQGSMSASVLQGLCFLYRNEGILTAPGYSSVLSCEV